MSYLVLARKWRPQTFHDMTGQEHVVKTVENAIARGRVAHAYLFCGPRGVGKTTAARILAKALNCQEGPTATMCGQCPACVEIAAGTSVDVVEIDGASNNGVENVREIRENAKYLPQRDRHKIYIIDEVHMLTTAAFNALLKTLEEPPGHVKFIFATTEPHKLPDTILSRCQRHNFRRVSTLAMLQRLKEICTAEQVALSESALMMVVRQSDGGMRDALSLLDQIVSACGDTPTDEAVADAIGAIDRTVVLGFVQALVRKDAALVLGQVERLFNQGVDFKRLAEDIAWMLRHLFVTQATGHAPTDLAEPEGKALLELSKEADAAFISRTFDIVHQAQWELSRQSQPRLTMEMTLLKAIQLAPAASIPDLLAKVEKLAGGSRVAAPSGAPGGRSGLENFRS